MQPFKTQNKTNKLKEIHYFWIILQRENKHLTRNNKKKTVLMNTQWTLIIKCVLNVCKKKKIAAAAAFFLSLQHLHSSTIQTKNKIMKLVFVFTNKVFFFCSDICLSSLLTINRNVRISLINALKYLFHQQRFSKKKTLPRTMRPFFVSSPFSHSQQRQTNKKLNGFRI
jgi:hypothetical protein